MAERDLFLFGNSKKHIFEYLFTIKMIYIEDEKREKLGYSLTICNVIFKGKT